MRQTIETAVLQNYSRGLSISQLRVSATIKKRERNHRSCMKNALVAAVGLSLFGLASGQTLEPINKELPSWLRFSGEYRARFEGFSGQSYQKGNDDLYLLNR